MGRHHQRIAFISLTIAEEMGLDDEWRTTMKGWTGQALVLDVTGELGQALCTV
ncbi:MAG: hypothetical protein AB1503_09045 [Bacillota bacterium]